MDGLINVIGCGYFIKLSYHLAGTYTWDQFHSKSSPMFLWQ